MSEQSKNAVERVYRALLRRQLTDEGLSARRVAAFVGKTTGALYHHFGSFECFLLMVSERGHAELCRRLEKAFARRSDPGDLGVAFVKYGLDHPPLYRLMFEHRFDWHALRKAGAFEQPLASGMLWETTERLLREAGSRNPATDTRLLWAGLHGLVSLAASGRINVRALERTDRAVACAAARELAFRILEVK